MERKVQNPKPPKDFAQDWEGSDGKYTKQTIGRVRLGVPAMNFGNEFDGKEPLPTMGMWKALYVFEGQNEGIIFCS